MTNLTAPLSRQCGTGKHRRKKRRKSGATNVGPEKRTRIDGKKRQRVDQQHTEEIHPEWLIKQPHVPPSLARLDLVRNLA
jgi:hypothetical protein